MKMRILQKALSVWIIAIQVLSTVLPFNFFIAESFATGNSGLNEAPDITSASSYSVNIGQTAITTLAVNDEDNVVMEYGTTKVVGNSWSTIKHSEMCKPVVVTSSRNDVAGLTRSIPRANNKAITSFDLKVDNQLSNIPAGQGTQMDWVVTNAGAQDFIDDSGNTLHIQAGSKTTSTIFGNSCRSNVTTSNDIFTPVFSAIPTVIHSVSSNNDPNSIGSTVNGNNGTYTSEPSTTQIGTFLQTAHGSCIHKPEQVDYIAADQGHYKFGGVEMDTVKSTDSVASVTTAGNPVTFSSPFSSVPQTILTSMLGVDGANGGTANVHSRGTVTTTTFPATIEEDDDVVTTSRAHTTEPVGAFAFADGNGVITQPNIFAYSLIGGADQVFFNLNQSGDLSFLTGQTGDLPLDSNADGVYEVEVEVCDSHCNSKCSTQEIRVEVNSSPTDITLTNNLIDENEPSGTVIGNLTSTDPNTGDTHTHSLSCSTAGADDADFSITGNILQSSVVFDFETKNSYEVCVKTDDGRGGIFEKIFKIGVNDLDEIPPVITLIGADPITLPKNASFTDPGATCTDDVDSTCSVSVGGASVDTTTLGSYIISYDAIDAAGNTASQVTRTVHIVPGDVPVITRTGPGSLNHEVLTTYADAGATAADTEDGDITGDIITVNPVDDTTLGSYTVTYDVIDSSDNNAIQVTRVVNVIDTTPPVITLVGSDPINVVKNSSYTDVGATALDNYDGNITANIVTVNPVDVTTLGTYTITYNVIDSSSNSATQVTRTVNVVPGDIPVITLAGASPLTVEVNTSYIDAGATANDTEDGDITGDILTNNSVDITVVGSYTVTYDVTDSSMNDAATVTRVVHVVDTTAPVITLAGSDPISIAQGGSFTDPGATCSDNYDTTCSVVVGGDTVDPTIAGTYVIRYDGVDAAGNNATQITRTVTVLPAPLLINEVEYDSPGKENEAEWFEIYNPTSGTVNIQNWTITEEVGVGSTKTFTFPSLSIPAGGYIIVTNETADFQAVYPGNTPDLDLPGLQYFNLKNSPSDSLTLRDPSGTDIDFVAWENVGAGWDIEAIDRPICRLLVPDTDLVADWSSDCIPTPQAVNDFNATPTDIMLSNDNFDENNSVNLNVGNFSTTDSDTADTHIYSLVAGAGDTDNGSFSISGNMLVFTPVADYETQPSYTIRVQTDDGKTFGTYEETFTITINDINLAPTDIMLSNTDIDENNTLGDTIGVLSGIDDGEDTNTLTYALACTTPGVDDAAFNIVGTNLNAAAVYDFETQNTYNICVQISDGVLTYEENFTITINDLDEVPPVVVITPVTMLQNSSITDTTITITDDVAVNVSDISIDALSSASASNLVCNQTSVTQVDCTVSIDTSGDLVITALDTSGNAGSDTETNYIVDPVPPSIPNVSVDTQSPFTVDNPELTFSSLDNVGVDYYTVMYFADDGGPGTGTSTTINPATSPVILTLDPDEGIHTIVITAYDLAGNSSSTTIKFPPVITISAPTTISNTSITDSTFTVWTPTGNDLTNIVLAPGTTGATLGNCVGAGGDTTDPYANPVTCDIDNISASGTITVTAEDSVILAQGQNSQSYIIDTTPPQITITAPTLIDNVAITDTTITVIDDTAIDVADVVISPSSTVTYSGYSCVQTNPTRVDCTVQIDDDGDLTIDATDLAGNLISDTEANYVIDTNPPVITLNGLDPETVEYLGAYTDADAIFTDIEDGTGTVLGAGSVNTGILGTYILTYDYTDIAGNPATQVTRTVNVVDTTIPVITLVGSTPETVEVNTSYSDAGATATDNFDGNLTSSIVTVDSVDITTVGTYTVTYDVTDSNGNVAAQVVRTVNIVDTTPPVIMLIGSNQITVPVGGSYSELGATATDNYDSFAPGDVVIDSSTVDTTTLGTYYVSYDITDSNGNIATQVIREVIVTDTEIPVIILVGSDPVTVEVNTSYTDDGATANDNYDGDITANIVAVNPVDITTVGTYMVTYDVVDSSGNVAAQVTRTVNVVDTTPPVITALGNSIETVEVNTVYIDAGATGTDNNDGNVTSSIVTVDSVDITTVGTYTVTYDVTDVNGNVATQVTRTVNVVDTTPPVITLTGSDPLTIIKNAPYTEFGATCNDNYDTTCSVIIGGATVDTSTIGIYIVTYDVTDTNGNVASQVTRTVNVVSGDTPLITLTGSDPITVEVNTSYLDAGATATDTEDGIITSNIVTVDSVDITTIGTYTVTYDVIDSSDNVATQVTRTVNVVDTTPPIINLTGPSSITLFRNSTYTEYGAICSDNYDTTCSVNIGGATVDTSTIGAYIVTYDVTDANGNIAGQVTRTVNIVSGDTPIITLTGSDPITVEVNTSYIDDGATASDTEDGNITANIVAVNPVDINTLGTYTVTYDVTDFSGNNALQVTRTVNVVDTIAPIITLTGNTIETVNLGDPYTDTGAVCTDNFDLICSVVTNNPIDVNTLGTYTITYDVTDANGNIAGQVTRTVNVVTGNPPVISLIGNATETVNLGDPYTDAGATANDIEDGDITTNIVTVNTVDINTLGTYTITYDVIDSNSNSAIQATRIVNIITGDIPVITLTGSDPVIVEVNTSYTDDGATATDTEDGNITANISTVNPVDINTLGSYMITYDVIDSNSNAAIQVTRTVNVVDTTAPIITLTGNTIETVNLGDSYTDAGATCIDNFDLTCTVSTVNPVDVNTLGIYTITYDAVDSNGNITSQLTRIVNVVSGNPPIISLTGDSEITQEVFESYIDAGATASDTEDGNITANIVTMNPVDINTLGSYIVTYNVIDSNLNSASPVERIVNIVDTEAPVMTLNGSSVVNIGITSSFTDLGVTCSDNYDAMCNIIVGGDVVDLNTDGVYTITYNTTDSSGNRANELTRTIVVDLGAGGSVEYDRCDGIDTSGSIFDGSCGDEVVEITDPEPEVTEEIIEDDDTNETIQDEISLPVTTEEEIVIGNPNDGEYNLENSFESCPIIDAINDPNYLYTRGGVFVDIANRESDQNILKFAEIGIVDGYIDGTFQPSREMTRTEFLKVALISHCYEYKNEDPTDLAYTDVDTNSWQAKVITKAQSLGMINGDISEDGQAIFRPNDIITKAEAVKILMRLSFIQAGNPEELSYTDIDVDWHKPYIQTGQTLGLFNPEKDNGVFRPNAGVRRTDMIDLIEDLVQLYR